MAIFDRVIRALQASAVNQLITTGWQFASVPLMLTAWGPNQYADWVAIAAVSAYFAVGEAGLGTATSNYIAMQAAESNYKEAASAYSTARATLCLFAIFLFVICFAANSLVDLPTLLTLTSVDRVAALWITSALACQVGLGFIDNLSPGLYRASNRYSRCLNIRNLMKVIEIATCSGALVYGFSLTAFAWLAAVIRLISVIISTIDAFSFWPGATIKHFEFDKRVFWILFRPSLAFSSLPIGNALRYQGVTLVAKRYLDTNEFIGFTAARTLSNTLMTLVTLFNAAAWPEFSTLYAKRETQQLRLLFSRVLSITAILTACHSVFLLIFGVFLVNVWTREIGSISAGTIFALILTTAIYSSWQTVGVVNAATNQFGKIAVAYLCGSAITVASAVLFVNYIGMLGLAMSTFLPDLVVFGLALAGVRVALNPRTGEICHSK